MNLSKKIMLSALTTGILVSPIIGGGNQINAAKQPQVNDLEAPTASLKVGDTVEFEHVEPIVLNARQVLIHRIEDNNSVGNKYRGYYNESVDFYEPILDSGEEPVLTKKYKFKIKGTVVDPSFGGTTLAKISIKTDDIEYIGSVD
ncbi:hypothetical protein [Staphylococcus succinus]|uniref:Peptidase n=1 Tax=Staphylococcus succinus TaxID=61015 RepID=A0ABX5IIL9_9STAP|nr:hypothetical protein [Staphylococcus succinus]PTI62168.1 hypothetical protein BU057_14180 [Staphylococcus succinus]RIN37846.1 hypothetical protein BU061_08940 [Staphylococcus succinus]